MLQERPRVTTFHEANESAGVLVISKVRPELVKPRVWICTALASVNWTENSEALQMNGGHMSVKLVRTFEGRSAARIGTWKSWLWTSGASGERLARLLPLESRVTTLTFSYEVPQWDRASHLGQR